MTTVATLDTVMRLNSTAFRQGMIDAATQANLSLGSIQKQATETASVLLQLKRAGEAAASLYLVKEGFDSLVTAQKQLQAIHYTFQAATGSASAAADAIAFVRKEAQDIGLALPGSAEGFAKLSAAATASGVSMKDQKELFDAFAKSSTTLHLSTDASGRALLALQEMFSRGTIQSRQLNQQLGQAIPGSAARFKNAVMEMTKGTDLAGKTFEQLIQKGELTTTKFMPALIAALRGTAYGWEEASHGLQSELNRLQTAWFDLKNQISTGLFSDTVTAGARTLATNLGAVANAITAVSVGALARAAGGVLSSGASKAQRLAQEYSGTKMAATAEREYADAQLASARAAQAEAAEGLRQTETALASTKAIQGQAQATRDLADANLKAAVLKKAAADADVARLGDAMTLPANIKYQQAMKAASVEAEAALMQAERQYNAALAAGNTTREQALFLQSNLNKARIEAIAATDALAAAEVRLAEAQAAEAAANSLAASVRGAAKSFGEFALGLVGGPWGAAVLAVGGLAYAYYKVQKASEDYRAETVEEVKALHDLADQTEAAAIGYGKLHDAQNLSQGIETFTGSSEELRKRKAELQDLRDQAQSLQDSINSRAENPNAGTALLDWFDQRKLDEVRERMASLEASMRPAEKAVGDLADKLGYGLEPSLDAVKEAIARIKAGGGLGDIWAGLTEGYDAGVQKLNDAKAQVEELSNDFASRVKGAEKDLLTHGKTQLQIGEAIQQKQIAKIYAQTGLTKAQQDAQVAALKAEQAQGMLTLKQDDAARSAKKNAQEANSQAEAYRNLKTSQDAEKQSLQQQIDGTDKGNSARHALNVMLAGGTAEFRKLTAAQQAERIEAQKQLVTMSDQVDKVHLQIAAKKQLADLDRRLAEEQAQRDLVNERQIEGMSHGSVWNEQQRAIEQIRDSYSRMRAEADRAYESSMSQAQAAGNLAQVQAQLDDTHAQAIGRITLAEAKAVVAQRQFYDEQKKMQDDWSSGVKAAMEDYVTEAGNVSKQAYDVTKNAFQSMENSLVEFVTTGKTSFKSLVASILTDLARMEIRIAMSRILTGLISAYFGYTGGTPADGGTTTATGGGGYTANLPFGGGRASGGAVAGGTLYEVAENNRPELLTSNGRTYLMTGANGGHVTAADVSASPAGRSTSSMGDVHVSVQVVQQADGSVQANTDARAYSQFGKDLGAAIKAAAREEIIRAVSPNGVIDKRIKGTA